MDYLLLFSASQNSQLSTGEKCPNERKLEHPKRVNTHYIFIWRKKGFWNPSGFILHRCCPAENEGNSESEEEVFNPCLLHWQREWVRLGGWGLFRHFCKRETRYQNSSKAYIFWICSTLYIWTNCTTRSLNSAELFFYLKLLCWFSVLNKIPRLTSCCCFLLNNIKK